MKERAGIRSDCFRMEKFPAIEESIKSFQSPSFLTLSVREKYSSVYQTLCGLIQKVPEPCFLLGAVVDFFEVVNREKCLFDPLNMAGFEFWLNNFSELSTEENRVIRAKIVGKSLPREDYQAFFPIGMGKSYFGSHFVVAHLSPDVDTMIASFSGWLDAFAARVGSGVHVWCVPGGTPASPVTSIFCDLFGKNVFRYLAREKRELHLTAMDLMTDEVLPQEKGMTQFLSGDVSYLTLRSDVEEMREKMGDRDFLTVIVHDEGNVLLPLGVVLAKNLRENCLGTVSWRDFSNSEEVCMPSYLRVISVVDHHKSAITTPCVSTIIVGDAQSCNVLIAEQTFLLNDRYSLGGMTIKQIEQQIQELSSFKSPSEIRILQRLLQRKMANGCSPSYFVHPAREFSEYLFFLHAILDDTDLLSKVSHRDLVCVVQLLNRLKSLSIGREIEVIALDDIPLDDKYLKTAAQRILQQPDMYSFYSEIHELKEAEIASDLAAFVGGKTSNIFVDTKEQNGCARVGQVKLFSAHIPFFLQHASEIRRKWVEVAVEIHQEKPEIDLFLQMISTIASAAEMYKNQRDSYSHQDELWFWVPSTRRGILHLGDFLAGFRHAIKGFEETLSLEFTGEPSSELVKVFALYFPNVPKKQSAPQEGESVVILRFSPGSLNSRKAMISPYLPK